MSLRCGAAIVLFALGGTSLGVALAGSAGEGAESAASGTKVTPSTPQPSPNSGAGAPSDSQALTVRYKPPLTIYSPSPPPKKPGAPEGSQGAATRGPERRCPAHVEVLVPENHFGLTVRSEPVLQWSLTEDTRCRVDFTLNDPRRPERPLVERTLASPFKKGIHSVRLEELGAQLDPDVNYEWNVAILEDTEHPSRNAVALALVRRIPRPSKLQPDQDAPLEIASHYAANGIWYDALAALSDGIRRNPGDQVLITARRELLDQVGLRGVGEE